MSLPERRRLHFQTRHRTTSNFSDGGDNGYCNEHNDKVDDDVDSQKWDVSRSRDLVSHDSEDESHSHDVSQTNVQLQSNSIIFRQVFFLNKPVTFCQHPSKTLRQLRQS